MIDGKNGNFKEQIAILIRLASDRWKLVEAGGSWQSHLHDIRAVNSADRQGKGGFFCPAIASSSCTT